MAKRRLRDGDVFSALAPSLGSALAERVVSIARRVKLCAIRAPESTKRSKAGYSVPGPRTAYAQLSTHPLRDSNTPPVRRSARALVEILSWLRPGKWRTGHPAQGHRLNVRALAARVGVSVRELERYLAMWESGGVLKRWQPPASSNAPKGNLSGHCFNLYELAVALPPELRAELERWHGRASTLERIEGAAAPSAPVDAPADALAIVDWLKSRAPAAPS